MDPRLCLTAVLVACLLLNACASSRSYVAPPGVPESALAADHRACIEESGIERLRDDQINWEQQCMMAHGYTLKP